jgi:hypothetical protein
LFDDFPLLAPLEDGGKQPWWPGHEEGAFDGLPELLQSLAPLNKVKTDARADPKLFSVTLDAANESARTSRNADLLKAIEFYRLTNSNATGDRVDIAPLKAK